jgi:tetratricopeptide (TPR) repeat protein
MILPKILLPVLLAVPVSCQMLEAGSEACSSCHSEIYNTYTKTVMARASGPAAEGLITGEFNHKQSKVHYRIYQRDDRSWMSYEREKEPQLHGQRELLYFIGSGVKGRSYLFSDQGFLFETPINWYSQEHRWEMTPAYTEAREVPLNLPAYTSCLNCHTSAMRPPLPGTDSKFSGKPYLHDGITCKRCHGSGEGHASGAGPIVNPAKLSPKQRDAVCMQCHFEGTVSVEQPGKHLYQFEPGESLSDYIHYFVLAGNPQSETVQALSQVEALSLSMCKRKSGDKMWCVSCHDPHREPSAEEKVQYYRAKCLNCHGEAFAAKHHVNKPDCTQCHMPPLPSQAVAHTQSTDHRILRRPIGFQLPVTAKAEPKLEPFPESDAPLVTTRDLGLAWETLTERKVVGASHEAEQFLHKAVKQWPDDAKVLSALGFILQDRGHEKEAAEFYELALKIDRLANDAATNLATIEARAGHLGRAIELWQGAFERVPNRSEIGIDLAIAFCVAGQKNDARHYVEQVLEFNPDSAPARRLDAHLNSDPPQCKP